MKKLGAIAVVIALLLGAAWYVTQLSGPASGGDAGAGRMRADPPLVVVAPVRREQLVDEVDALGTAFANESLTLTAKVTDTVRRVNFEDGQFIEGGTVLIELTNQEEEALLAEARANLEDAEKQLERLEDLSARGLTAASELDMARSRAAASEARLNTVVARLRDRLIQAPFSGVLGFREVSPGTLVTPSTPITTLDDISIIKLDFTVPETFLGVMEPGAKVFARSASWPDREFEGEVRTVGSRVDPVTRAVVVRAHVPNPDSALRPGMLLTVRVIMAERTALTVPEGAVFELRDQAYVFQVGSDQIARQKPVEIGDRRFGKVEVLAGLGEGDLVVSEGTIKLRDGIPIRLAEPAGVISEDASSPRARDSLAADSAPGADAG
jgi:membrane fusion protein (multidrug efflux system)